MALPSPPANSNLREGAKMTTRKTKPSRKAPASDNAGILRRFKKIISTLQDCYVAPGWQQTFDRKTAAKLVRYLERQAAGKRSYAPLDRELYNFLHAHGQCIDYLLMGRVNAMICRLASQSPAAQAIPGDRPTKQVFAGINFEGEVLAQTRQSYLRA